MAQRRIPFAVLLVVLTAASQSTPAQVSNTEIARTETVLTKEVLAEQWQLSIEDWTAYRTLMEGPRGIWSPNLDPITVLGIHAETDAERRRYAELLVMMEFERVEQELKFQQAYDEAAQRLFPGLAPVATVAEQPISTLVGPERIAFVGSIDSARCPTCRSELARLLGVLADPASPPLDVFLEDAIDDNAIRDWAVDQAIDPQRVIAGRITLNYARDGLELPSGVGPVSPSVLQRRGGRWSVDEAPR